MVYCWGCGKPIHKTANSCPHCGAMQKQVTNAGNPSGTLWLPVPALILGCFCFIAVFDESQWDSETSVGVVSAAISAILLGLLGAWMQERGRGISVTAVILGAIGVIGVINRLFQNF